MSRMGQPSNSAVLALLFAASLVPAFDYSIGRVDEATRQGRFESFERMANGTIPAPYRYRVLVPYTVAPVVAALAPVWSRETAFRRVDAVFNLLAIWFLLWTAWRYLGNWFTSWQALAGALLVACTLPISLRHHLYSPYSLLEPSLLLLAMHWVANGRTVAVLILSIVASLNRETGFLVGLALLFRSRRLGVLSLCLSGGIALGLRTWLGTTPPSITLSEIWAVNTSREGLLAALTSVTLFLGGAGWLLAVRGWRRLPPFVLHLWWLPLFYVPLYLVAGIWYEVRLLMPLYVVLLPAVLAGMWPHKLTTNGANKAE